MSTVEDLLRNHQQVIEDVRLIPGGSGIFDVAVNGELIYSKHAAMEPRHLGVKIGRASCRERV